MTQFERACIRTAELIRDADYAVFFGGAGVSTDSGLTDFRSRQTGLYNRPSSYGAPPEEILTPRFMREQPEKFFDFYRRELLDLSAPPNRVHYALAELERLEYIKCVVTQNADCLHQRAGSRRVLDIHGNVYVNYCVDCGQGYPPEKVADCAGVPHCERCGGMVRPGILLFGEVPDMGVIMETVRELNRADLLVIGGSSLKVSSAPRLLDRFRGRLAIINAEPTPFDGRADVLVRGRIGPAFEIIMSTLTKGDN